MPHATDSVNAQPEGMFNSLKVFAASLVSHLHTRLQLFAIEFAEERLRLTSLLIGTILAMFFAFMALLLAVLFIIAVYWDTPYRLYAIAVLAVVFMLGGAITAWIIRARLKNGPPLFEASLAELYKDQQQLDST